MTYYPAIGSISSGTMRTKDLLGTFSSELSYHMKRMRLTRDQRRRFNTLLRDYQRADFDDDECTIGEDTFDSGELLTEFFDALGEIAPPYCYFGAAKDDGACYGFWPALDFNNRDRYGRLRDNDLQVVNAGDEIPRGNWGEDVLLVNDHGNVTCGHVDKRGRFKAYWDCV